jgi:hypothetical protein
LLFISIAVAFFSVFSENSSISGCRNSCENTGSSSETIAREFSRICCIRAETIRISGITFIDTKAEARIFCRCGLGKISILIILSNGAVVFAAVVLAVLDCGHVRPAVSFNQWVNFAFEGINLRGRIIIKVLAGHYSSMDLEANP